MNTPQSPARAEIDQALPELPEPRLYEHGRVLGQVLMPSVRKAWIADKSPRVEEYSSPLFTADQVREFATEAIAAERAEVVRLRELAEKLLSACVMAGPYVGGEAPDHEAEEWFDIINEARAAIASTTPPVNSGGA